MLGYGPTTLNNLSPPLISAMPSIKSFSHLLIASLIALLLLGGCATTELPSNKWSAEKFYQEAQKSLKISDFESAIKNFEDLEVHHPFSPYTQQAQLEVAYAYYKYDEPDSALAALDRYIKLYPRADNVDYAYYLRGLVSMERGTSSFDLWLGLDTTKRQPQTFKNAFSYFKDLINRYPNSEYSLDAKQRMVALRNHLAAYELHAADYYMRRGAYLSAANRAKYVLENYPQTPATPDALAILAEAYQQLGIQDLADNALEVLKLNFPNHKTIAKLGESSTS